MCRVRPSHTVRVAPSAKTRHAHISLFLAPNVIGCLDDLQERSFATSATLVKPSLCATYVHVYIVACATNRHCRHAHQIANTATCDTQPCRGAKVAALMLHLRVQ